MMLMKTILFRLITSRAKAVLPVYIMALAVLTACEKEVEFKAPGADASSSLTINSIAVEGEPLRVFLNRTYTVGQAPPLNAGYSYAFTKDDKSIDYQTPAFYKKTGVFDAEVKAVVNGALTYSLELAPDSMGYTCDYRPKENDRIEIKAEGVSAETTVPTRPHVEVLSHEVLTGNPYTNMAGLTYDTDTIMRLSSLIREVSGSQYYRLRVRGERKITKSFDVSVNGELVSHTDYAYYLLQDIYFSEDELFVDNRLTESFGGWPAYFSNVFDDTLIKGGGHSFTVVSPKPSASMGIADFKGVTDIMKAQADEADIPARVMVELQAISPELYRYLKSVQLYRVTENDAFSEPVQIYSNVENGWGIFGSLSSSRVFIPYD